MGELANAPKDQSDPEDRGTWRTNRNNIAVNYRLLGRSTEAIPD
jgi:hypothetical protein